MIVSRRNFLTGLSCALAAPAVVKAEFLMPVKKVIAPVVLNVGPTWVTDLMRYVTIPTLADLLNPSVFAQYVEYNELRSVLTFAPITRQEANAR